MNEMKEKNWMSNVVGNDKHRLQKRTSGGEQRQKKDAGEEVIRKDGKERKKQTRPICICAVVTFSL